MSAWVDISSTTGMNQILKHECLKNYGEIKPHHKYAHCIQCQTINSEHWLWQRLEHSWELLDAFLRRKLLNAMSLKRFTIFSDTHSLMCCQPIWIIRVIFFGLVREEGEECWRRWMVNKTVFCRKFWFTVVFS